MSHYRDSLKDRGIAASRTWSVESSMNSLHSALCHMDSHNIRVFNTLYPGVAQAVNDFVAFNEGLAFICEDLQEVDEWDRPLPLK